MTICVMGVTVLKPDEVDSGIQVVLASASPRRRSLLTLLGVSFSIQPADVDEEPLAGEGPEQLTTRLARSKAIRVASTMSYATPPRSVVDSSRAQVDTYRTQLTNCDAAGRARPDDSPPDDPVVLAADTVVVRDHAILGKPADEIEAMAMLESLRGRAHRVLTGLALAVSGEIAWTSVVDTAVWMRSYGQEEVERYVRSGVPLDRAGAYGIQDTDFQPVVRIEGCYSNVVGLPLCEVRRALTALDPDRRWGPGWRAADAQPAASPPWVSPSGASDACHLCDRARDL